MRGLGWGVLAGALCAFSSQAADFDDRWFVTTMAGGAFTDRSNTDAGFAVFGTVGRRLYPRLTLEAEVGYLVVDVANVANSGMSAEFSRAIGGVKANFDLMKFENTGLDLSLIGGAFVHHINWLSVAQNGFGYFTGLAFSKQLDGKFDFVGQGRYAIDAMDAQGPIRDDQYYTWTLTAGLRYSFGQWPPPPPDSDGDGVADALDQCPNTPFGAEVNELGCSLDSDGDGVPDHRDKCPNTPIGVPVDADGCPLDSDRDGVIDPVDRCPDTPLGVPVDADGCPLDSDQDGVINSKDLCPNTPFGAEVDVNGCPYDTDQDGVPDFRDDCPNTPYGVPVNERGCSRDNDGDGVANALDQCPNTFPGLEVDKMGCPVRNQVITLHNVHFEFDRADLLPDSRQLLRRVAKSLNDQPGLRIEVAGHTDSKGSEAYNQKLSERRAAAVRKFLVSEGVAADSIVSKGYGETRPIAENVTEEGREQNRRVEIHLLD